MPKMEGYTHTYKGRNIPGVDTKKKGGGMNVGKRASGSGKGNTKSVSRMAPKGGDTGGAKATRSIMRIGPSQGGNYGNKGSMTTG